MYRFPEDQSTPIITAEAQIHSTWNCQLQLPQTAIVFFMGRGIEYLRTHFDARELPEPFPRFLKRCPIWQIDQYQLCFLDGGRGAPQACDTVETLAALGVKNIISVGMFGAFDPRIQIGDMITPEKAFVEEGTSLHYYESIEYSAPDKRLLQLATSVCQAQALPIVSTDAIYRQTFYKEQLWREKGAVGVDMETSVVFSVCSYLGLNATALLMASDLHPIHPNASQWAWKITKDLRDRLAERSMALARSVAEAYSR